MQLAEKKYFCGHTGFKLIFLQLQNNKGHWLSYSNPLGKFQGPSFIHFFLVCVCVCVCVCMGSPVVSFSDRA